MNVKKILFVLLFAIPLFSIAQVGIGTTSPNSSSMLDVTATDKGVLIPRMTAAQKTAITTPATGLLIFQTDGISGFYYYNGTIWKLLGGSGWSLTGDAGTTAGTNFIGTTDGQDFVIKTNNTEAARVNTSGFVGIGTNNPNTKLHVSGTTTLASSGTSTLYSNDFSTGSITSIAGTGNTCTTTPNIWYVNSTSSWASCTTCAGNRAYIEYSSSCNQNQMFKSTNFTPTTTSIAISFKYGYDDYSGSSTDSFVVTLYNETTSTTVATLLNLTSDALDASYSANSTVIAGNNYSLRFTYTGNNCWGAAVDTILITEATTPTAGSYVFRLSDGTQGAGKVLNCDANGNAYWATAGSGSSSYTFTNGLTETSGTVKLGGTLTQDTSINTTSSYNFNFSTPTYSNLFRVDSDENVIKLGHNTTPYNDGATITLDGNSTTVEYLLSPYIGGSRGTTIGVGSIEYMTDGEASVGISDTFLPITTGLNLGSSTSRWSTLYCVNTVNVSDQTLKKDISPIQYGLNEIMKLNPVSYKWKDNKIGNQTIPENLQETKLGFLAQDLQKIIPEVVKSNDWKKSENGNYTYTPNSVLGVMYTDIIPVTVKAIQEQQKQIENLESQIKELKRINEILIKKLDVKP